MKYTTEEELDEIMHRSRKITIRRECRKVQIQACLTCAVSLLVIAALILLPKGAVTTSDESVYGAFLLADGTGGYVLVALISFILGVVVTVLSMKYRRLREMDEKEEKASNRGKSIESK